MAATALPSHLKVMRAERANALARCHRYIGAAIIKELRLVSAMARHKILDDLDCPARQAVVARDM